MNLKLKLKLIKLNDFVKHFAIIKSKGNIIYQSEFVLSTLNSFEPIHIYVTLFFFFFISLILDSNFNFAISLCLD